MISAILCALLISQAHAAVFFAEDPNPDGADNQNEVTPLLSAPLSDAEREAFESLIQNPETETFDDGFVDGQTTPLELTFQCLTETVKATITGEGGRIEDDVKNGQYPISGRYYFRTRSDTFTVTFNTSVAAVGFYAVDIGDVRGQLSINLFATSTDTGAFNSILIGHTIEALSGSVFFFGVVDEDNPFQAITFSNSAAGRDVFAFDNFIVACPEQIFDPCAFGIPDPSGTVCCCESCGSCGGCDCEDRDGGAEKCCPQSIHESGIPCLASTDCGCILDEKSPMPTGGHSELC
uniref:Uncharacterized protein n=1 Tax=Pinguiococcus pyrenoidosus TaxID=172671 RepID=A0A7R9Y7X9_9STRA|mmetsp:Transcript_10124/g.38395  ORF Transcript_10124/g.38395 Transcript_10124/m.38395 type:complete len:293 (+) Transcript_10124:169-1047(+)